VPLRRAIWLYCRQARAAATVENDFRIVFWSRARFGTRFRSKTIRPGRQYESVRDVRRTTPSSAPTRQSLRSRGVAVVGC
jgi:hypothetical protein